MTEGQGENLVKVLILTYSYFVDSRPMRGGKHDEGIQFNEHDVAHPEIAHRALGERAILGVADVPEELYEEFYKGHPAFVLLAEYEEMVRDEVAAAQKAERAARGVVETEDDLEEDQGVLEVGEGAGPVQGGGQEKPPESPKQETTPNPLAGVNFASDRAGEVAAELGLTADDMGKIRPGGKGMAYTVPNVRSANKKRVTAQK